MALRPMLREVIASTLAQRTTALLSAIIVAGMCASVLLTAGKVAGAEDTVISSIDNSGSRSIVVRVEPGAGVDSRVLERISLLQQVAWAGAFGPSSDGINTAIPGGRPISVRNVWTDSPRDIDIEPARTGYDGVWLSKSAALTAGFAAPNGSVETEDGQKLSVLGIVSSPSVLKSLQPVALRPRSSESVGTVSVIVAIADKPEDVTALVAAIPPLLSASDPSKISISTDGSLARLRVLVQNQLSFASQALTLAILTVSGLLVFGVLTAVGNLKRRDFGRRRALGATRGFIVALVLGQTFIASVVGTLLGASASAVLLVTGNAPLPRWDYFIAVMIISLAISCLAALAPALVASRRDPLRELRVP